MNKIKNTPKHVAIILDGNRRWARDRSLKPWEGHFAGIGKNADDVAQTAIDEGIKYLTLWAGSYDNLTKRSKMEIRMLNKAYRQFIEKILADERTYKNEVRIRFVGEWMKLLEPKTIDLIKKIQKATRGHRKNHMTMLVGYNGDREMLSAINSLIKKGAGRVSDTALHKSLWTDELPPVDLVIRSGVRDDPHNSAGFMMWHTRYSQLYFTSTLWPDFDKKEFLAAIKSFSRRERRLGK